MLRRRRHHRDLRPSLGKLSLKDRQRQLGSDFGLPGEDRDHPRFKASFGLPHEALECLVRFATPAHPVREGLGLDAGQFGRRLAIAPTTNGVKDDGRDPSVGLSGVSWLTYTAYRLGTFEARSEDVPLVSCLEAVQLNAVCGSPLFSPCRDRNVHRLVLDGRWYLAPGLLGVAAH